MSEPQKLHPISYVSTIINVIKNNIFLVVLFLIFGLKDFNLTDYKSYIYPGIMLTFFMISFIINLIRVYSTRYWLEGKYFIVRSGIVNITRKEIDIRRIQSIDTTQDLSERILGSVKLQIKTPSDGVDLRSVSRPQSVAIEQAIHKAQDNLGAELDSDGINDNSSTTTDNVQNRAFEKIYSLSFKELLFMATTSGAIGIALLTVGPIVMGVSDYLPMDKIFGEFSVVVKNSITGIIFLIILALLIAHIVGTVIEFIRNYGFTVYQSGEQLKIRYGLISVQSVTVPTDRVQAVYEKQTYLRKLFGYTSLSLIVTSDMDDGDDEATPNGRVEVLPFIKRKKGYDLFKTLVPSMYFESPQTGMPWRGFHRYFWRESLVILLIASIVHYYWKPYFYPVAGVLILLLVIYSLLAVNYSGFTIRGDEISVRNARILSYRNYYVKRDKLLGVNINSNPFMTREHLGNFKLKIAKATSNESIGLRFEDLRKVKGVERFYLGGRRDESI
ncbi:PH domain-containing protein [Staphylococcus sp. SQ8-PEA]|uniref:PH domain-containing protein n=1 Tax=Staphylococcus marylandisciuri TaxID=2981529 RepID=A0ABT2QRD8_9STAP|nr:PH domain-containing protein [Staphylococcus marylandisciuri]MCU5746546.1 PH domain-containing protein [Staphylococcus marylandisciuri]